MKSPSSTPSPANAIVLFAHGSRDPLWRAPMEAVAEKIRALSPAVQVRCSYLELCEPSLPQAVQEVLEQLGAMEKIALSAMNTLVSSTFHIKIRIVPMFLGMGKHAREDLPELVRELRAQHPQVEFEIAQAVGEDEHLQKTLAELALA